jgi:hypothetical protein
MDIHRSRSYRDDKYIHAAKNIHLMASFRGTTGGYVLFRYQSVAFLCCLSLAGVYSYAARFSGYAVVTAPPVRGRFFVGDYS